ncbi:hypothetical protein ACKWTF_015389 [Chironomus riparius]
MVDKESLTEILDGLKTDLNFEDYEHDVMKPVKVTTGLWIKKCKAAVGAFNFWYKLRDDQLKIAEEHFFGLNAPVRILDEIMDGPTKYWSVMSSHGSGGINLSIASSQIAIFQIFNKLAKSNDENSQEILKHCIECLEVVNKGQAIEILWRENFQCPSIADYFNMTKMKVNAAFFMLDDIMTILSGNKTDYKEIIALFGIYFQIHNDYYNLFAPDHKNRHQDFADDLTEASAIKCYQCNALICDQLFDGNQPIDIEPAECDKSAKYCVKLVGVFEALGKAGAMRYCSTHNFRNNCKLVDNKELGDAYEQCIYTCDSDGCNI